MRNRIFNVKKIYILVFVVFGLIVLLDHSSTFLLYFQLLFTQKKKKKAKYLSVWDVLHMSSKFCLNSASTSLYNKKTNKQTKKTKQNKTKQKRIKTMKMKYKSVGGFSLPAGYQTESSHVKSWQVVSQSKMAPKP